MNGYLGWMDSASCANTSPEIFFPETGQREWVAEAKKICGGCPVSVACLDYALTNKFADGIYGGTVPLERYRLMKGRKNG